MSHVGEPVVSLMSTHVPPPQIDPGFVDVHASMMDPLQYVVQIPCTHAGRLPCGDPRTAVQVPPDPGTLHAAHCPVQAELQQAPSTQKPDAHVDADVHVVP